MLIWYMPWNVFACIFGKGDVLYRCDWTRASAKGPQKEIPSGLVDVSFRSSRFQNKACLDRGGLFCFKML